MEIKKENAEERRARFKKEREDHKRRQHEALMSQVHPYYLEDQMNARGIKRIPQAEYLGIDFSKLEVPKSVHVDILLGSQYINGGVRYWPEAPNEKK